MNKIVVSKEYNPYYNLALEEDLLYKVKEGETIFYLWQNEKTVVIGRNQNPWLECNIEKLHEKGIHLARRISGGGAVFHDLGNLNFTFISRTSGINLEKQLSVLKEALNALDLSVTFSGRNDLLLNGKKFSGHAFYEDEDYYFHHGTLMVDVSLNTLEGVLTPSPLKLKAKSIASVKSRVTNLKEAAPFLTIPTLIHHLTTSFKTIYSEPCVLQEIDSKIYIPEKFAFYQSKSWIYGETPKFELLLEEKLEQSLLQIGLKIENGTVKDAYVFSDSLEKIDMLQIKNRYLGKNIEEVTSSNLRVLN